MGGCYSLEVFDRPPFSPSENYSVKLRYRRIMYLPLDFLSVWLLDILFCIFSAVGCWFSFFLSSFFLKKKKEKFKSGRCGSFL